MQVPFEQLPDTNSFQRPYAPPAFAEALQRSLDQKHDAERQVHWQELRRQAHTIKAYTIANLDKLLIEFEQQFQARGGRVLWAQTASEAVGHVLEICRQHNVTSAVKGKSMLSEELELNTALSQDGIEAVETDLGEFIVQLAGQRPSHIVGPALHLTRYDVGAIFAQRLGVPYTDDPQRLLGIARAHLRQRYLQAQVGITGVNFGVAETGTAVVVENEGNGGLSASVPPVHILLMGIEKLIPRFCDLPIFLSILARAGTGQRLTTYTHHFLGPPEGGATYCILVDANRTKILADRRTRESLYCIRCGACLNVCPVYRRAGGWAYGSAYSGPIGAVITPLLHGNADNAELPFASTLCGACQHECPVNIDLPHQLVYLRRKMVSESKRAATPGKRSLMRLFTWAMLQPTRYALAVSFLRATLNIALQARWKPWPLSSWVRRRAIPVVPRQTFKSWWKQQRADK